MKLLGEVHDFRPRAIVAFVLRALRVGWLWFAVLLMAVSFFAFLTMLSWFPVSFVIPATSLAYVAGAIGAKLFLGEQLNGDALGGNCSDLPRCGHGLGGRSCPRRFNLSQCSRSCAGRFWRWPWVRYFITSWEFIPLGDFFEWRIATQAKRRPQKMSFLQPAC